MSALRQITRRFCLGLIAACLYPVGAQDERPVVKDGELPPDAALDTPPPPPWV